jgi:hypothetical protein
MKTADVGTLDSASSDGFFGCAIKALVGLKIGLIAKLAEMELDLAVLVLLGAGASAAIGALA